MTTAESGIVAAWKYLADRYLADTIAYYFPELHAQADWQQQPQLLDRKLDKMGLDPGDRRLIARLIQLPMLQGPPRMVILHVTDCPYDREDFERRMARATRRIFERYQLPFTVLTVDLSPPSAVG